MSGIDNITDFEVYFPPQQLKKDSSSEWHSPCPFCANHDEGSFVYNSFRFSGTDRLIWNLPSNYFWCRRCHIEGRKSIFSLIEMGVHFSIVVDPLSVKTYAIPKAKREIDYWSLREIFESHANVQRDYWYRFGWTDEIINHFKLGFGEINYNKGNAHLIPMNTRTVNRPANLNQHFMSGRIEGEAGSHQLVGSKQELFWYVHEDLESKIIVLPEGEKDAITAWMLGFKNFATAFGAGLWDYERTKFLKEQGFEVIYSFGDNDPAGHAYNHRVAAFCKELGLTHRVLNYEDRPQGFDLTDLFIELKENTYIYILSHLIEIENIESYKNLTLGKPAFIDDYRRIDPEYAIEPIQSVSLADLRGEGELSIYKKVKTFLSLYSIENRGRGKLLLLRASPGAGKSHTLVRVCEEIATIEVAKRENIRSELVENIESLKTQYREMEDADEKNILKEVLLKMEKKLADFSLAAIAWVSPFKVTYNDILDIGADKNLWFDYKARSEDNCENFAMAKTLGENNHNIGAYCEFVCPFKQRCLERGYLSQERERKKYPITIFRHQSLVKGGLGDDYKSLVVVDESPFHVVEEPFVFFAKDFYPHKDDWDFDITDINIIKAMDIFIDSVRFTMNYNIGLGQKDPNYMISGTKFLKHLDKQIQTASDNTFTLQRVFEIVPEEVFEHAYQPLYLGDSEHEVKLRCVPFLYKAIRKELDNYVSEGSNNLPSCIHLVSGRLEIYSISVTKIPSTVPVIVADGTADLIQRYDVLFNREVDLYGPTLYNPNAETIVFRGSDWTLSQIESQLGKEIRDRQQRSFVVKDVAGETFDLNELPVLPTTYDKPILKDYKDVILSLVERHPNLLVITHKKVRPLIEEVVRAENENAYNRIAWGHYGALRGTNSFKDLEAVLLVGVARMPYEIMYRRIQAWASVLDINEEIPFDMSYHPAPYHTQHNGSTYFTFNHPFARSYADAYEVGEMLQCQERIRPHATDKTKYIYVFASRPSSQFIKKVLTKADFLSYHRLVSPINRLKEFLIREWREHRDIPRRKDILERFNCGTLTYQKARSLAEKELDIKFPNKRR